jgi:flagellar basal-body rod protein FlgB
LTGGETFQLLGRALDLRDAAHARIAANLAHQDTPGYKARSLDFQDALKAAVGSGGGLAPAATNPAHFGAGGNDAILRVTGTEHVQREGGGHDGNTVSPDAEMARLAENALMFDTAARIITAKYQGLRGVIREGR